MPVELTPNGTRGVKMPAAPPRPLRKLVANLGTSIFRLMRKPTCLLTTVGAKSGKQHTVGLLAVPDGPDAWIVAASYAGSAKHPAWFFNMAKNPDNIWLQVPGREKLRVTAETLKGAARAEAWQRIVAIWSGYAGYQQKTDREIPVVRLTPA